MIWVGIVPLVKLMLGFRLDHSLRFGIELQLRSGLFSRRVGLSLRLKQDHRLGFELPIEVLLRFNRWV